MNMHLIGKGGVINRTMQNIHFLIKQGPKY